jgi:hypothetical protein
MCQPPHLNGVVDESHSRVAPALPLRSVCRRLDPPEGRNAPMLWTLIVLLMLFWLLGFAFDVAGGIIHVLLVIAVVLFLVNLITGRRTVV